MQTLTIQVDDSYVEQILNFLQQIPKNKREIFQHQKINLASNKIAKKEEDFLRVLENGPTISEKEADAWDDKIKQGYKSWTIETF